MMVRVWVWAWLLGSSSGIMPRRILEGSGQGTTLAVGARRRRALGRVRLESRVVVLLPASSSELTRAWLQRRQRRRRRRRRREGLRAFALHRPGAGSSVPDNLPRRCRPGTRRQHVPAATARRRRLAAHRHGEGPPAPAGKGSPPRPLHTPSSFPPPPPPPPPPPRPFEKVLVSERRARRHMAQSERRARAGCRSGYEFQLQQQLRVRRVKPRRYWTSPRSGCSTAAAQRGERRAGRRSGETTEDDEEEDEEDEEAGYESIASHGGVARAFLFLSVHGWSRRVGDPLDDAIADHRKRHGRRRRG